VRVASLQIGTTTSTAVIAWDAASPNGPLAVVYNLDQSLDNITWTTIAKVFFFFFFFFFLGPFTNHCLESQHSANLCEPTYHWKHSFIPREDRYVHGRSDFQYSFCVGGCHPCVALQSYLRECNSYFNRRFVSF
jgi:hypothetical protein